MGQRFVLPFDGISDELIWAGIFNRPVGDYFATYASNAHRLGCDISMFFISVPNQRKLDLFGYAFMCVAVTVQALLTLLYLFCVVQNMLRVVWGVQIVLGSIQSVST